MTVETGVSGVLEELLLRPINKQAQKRFEHDQNPMERFEREIFRTQPIGQRVRYQVSHFLNGTAQLPVLTDDQFEVFQKVDKQVHGQANDSQNTSSGVRLYVRTGALEELFSMEKWLVSPDVILRVERDIWEISLQDGMYDSLDEPDESQLFSGDMMIFPDAVKDSEVCFALAKSHIIRAVGMYDDACWQNPDCDWYGRLPGLSLAE